jgi:hypothetical protein
MKKDLDTFLSVAVMMGIWAWYYPLEKDAVIVKNVWMKRGGTSLYSLLIRPDCWSGGDAWLFKWLLCYYGAVRVAALARASFSTYSTVWLVSVECSDTADILSASLVCLLCSDVMKEMWSPVTPMYVNLSHSTANCISGIACLRWI